MHVLQVVEHVIVLKTSFLQKFTYIMYCYILDQNMGACEYIQITHWLATGYFIGQAWKTRYIEEFFGDDHAS